MGAETIFLILILIFSVVLHEVSHGYAANMLGDPTARLQGRLTLNPISHLDPLGSVILPAILALSGSPFLFGWAKPVPYNPYNFKRGGRWAEALVAGAGPAVNIFIAVLFALVVRFGAGLGLPTPAIELGFLIVLVNVMLAIFNMIPIPPLDGSKVLAALLPGGLASVYERFRQQLEFNPFLGFGIVIIFILVFGGVFGSAVFNFARLLVGA